MYFHCRGPSLFFISGYAETGTALHLFTLQKVIPPHLFFLQVRVPKNYGSEKEFFMAKVSKGNPKALSAIAEGLF